jgi:hypothetical protein
VPGESEPHACGEVDGAEGASGVGASTARITASTSIASAQPCRSGHTAWPQGRHGMSCHSTVWRCRSGGAQRATSAPLLMTTLGRRSAAAMCDRPVSLQTTRSQRSISAPSVHRLVRPTRLTGAVAMQLSSARPSSASGAPPVSTTVRPCAASRSATWAKRSNGQRRDGSCAPACRQTYGRGSCAPGHNAASSLRSAALTGNSRWVPRRGRPSQSVSASRRSVSWPCSGQGA